MYIYTEITPNPSTLKFVTDRVLLQYGTLDFPNLESAKGRSNLAEKLFEHNFVAGVFLGYNFVTITKIPDKPWVEVIPLVKESLKTFLLSGATIVEDGLVEIPADYNDDISSQIQRVIDEQIRPAVAMDGGDIIFDGFEDGIVKLRMQGSCQGCPSSSITLKMGIENLLIRLFPNEVKFVEAV